MIASAPATIEIAPAAIRIQPLLRAPASGSGAVSVAMARRLPAGTARGNGAGRCPRTQACLPRVLLHHGRRRRGLRPERPVLEGAAGAHDHGRALRDLLPDA